MPRTNRQIRSRSSVVMALLVAVWFGGLTTPGFLAGRSRTSAPTPPAYRAYGMDFSPYIDGQDPNLETIISEDQLRARMQIIADHTIWVRSFGCTHGLEKVGLVAHSLGLKAAVGAWLGRNLAANNQEIANLISAANAGQVDLAIVGSEVLLRNDLSETQLIDYMNQVRQQIPANIPVATADVYEKLLEHPAVIANCDVVLPNYYPYWSGVSINTSIATLHRQHQQMVAAAQGKPVIVSETGWPSAGNVICNAVPSPANASFYFQNFVSWARANNVSYFYFDALDETWKASHGEGPQGSHWGVWDKDGVLKPGMQAVFDGQTMPDNWTSAGVPGGSGSPSMEFAYVPPYGSSNNLFGQVLHVNTDDYKVAVYIYVGGWWTKPTFANPLTNIGLDGSWECDITTGGNDVLATQIVAFLVPKDYSPPPMSGAQTLPSALDQNSVARTEIARSSSSPYIAGKVTDSNNQGLSCVTISLTGSQTATTHTISNGDYAFINLQPGGNYTVTPSHPSYTFDPLSLTFSNLGSNQTGNFVAAPSISTITLSASPAAGGTVSGGGTFASGSSRTVTATANSGYTFANWTENGSLVSSSASYAFTLNSNRSLVANFTSILGVSNPIDQAGFFVRQHYHDFLNREPDQGGLDFWTNQITSCGSDLQCIEVKRINVSAAFFLSIEFQQTGNLVYKMYKAAFGNLPGGKPVAVDRVPFMIDTRQIQSTPAQVIVGQGNWQQQLETNKQAFALAFVQRSAFQTQHASQTADQYVSSLFANTGASPTDAETSDAIAAFNNAGGGDAGRAAALRSIAESGSVHSKLVNEAFALMQYFGYLQRNPYDAPESTLDYQGFNFWLSKLNSFGGDYIKAEMVKAFITSDEYRHRFGP